MAGASFGLVLAAGDSDRLVITRICLVDDLCTSITDKIASENEPKLDKITRLPFINL